MTEAMRIRLTALAEPDYRDFQHSLLPGVENYLGVPLPALHKIAAELARNGWQTEFAAPDRTFEETLVRGMVIGRLHLPKDQLFALVRDYVPCIHDWLTCDTFCSVLKQAKLYKEDFYILAAEYCRSNEEFYARFGAVLLLRYYADRESLPKALEACGQLHCPAFYARMGLAWAWAEFAAVDFDAVIAAMRAADPDDDTWNRALQKMRESRRILPEQKELCKQWKRNKR